MATEKNLLLLSMSILNNVAESCYEGSFSDNQKCYFRGVSQLEIGTKYYLRQMEKRNKQIDKIFIVESLEASNNPVKIDEINPYLTGPTLFIKPVTNSGDNGVTNAVDFYKDRIAQYIRGEEQPGEPVKYPKLSEEIENYEKEEKRLSEKYSQEFVLEELFSDIPIPKAVNGMQDNEENLLNVSVQNLCNQIKYIAEDNTSVNLFLDIQGAQRFGTFIINAAVNMLALNSNINVKYAVAIDYQPHNNENGSFNQIVDTTFNDRMFKMVSGMNQFITTGRGDLLQQFQNLASLKSENPIITSINNISDRLSICNMAKFDESIDDLKKAIDNYKTEKNPNRLFQIFVEDLETEYTQYGLLDDQAVSPIINRVKWCLSKRLYQQALTLLEAQAPDDIVKNKIIYYGEDYDLAQLVDTIKKNDWCKEKIYSNETDAHVLIHHILTWSKVEEANEIKYVWHINKNIKSAESKFSLTVGSPYYDFRTKNEIEEGVEPKYLNFEIGALLKHYDGIRRIRNSINHSLDYVILDGKRKSINVNLVSDNINKFVECYDRLLGNQVEVNLSEQFSIISA